MMLKRATMPPLLLVLLLAITASACSVVGGIFKAGVWVGVIAVVLVLLVVLWLVSKARH